MGSDPLVQEVRDPATGLFAGYAPLPRLKVVQELDLLRDALLRQHPPAPMRWLLRDIAGAQGDLDRALTLYREIGDKRGQAATLDNLGLLYADAEQPREAAHHHEQALSLYRSLGLQAGVMSSLVTSALRWQHSVRPRLPCAASRRRSRSPTSLATATLRRACMWRVGRCIVHMDR